MALTSRSIGASIQYANLDGSASGQQEVVARGPNGVVAYKYDTAANQWNQLPSTNAISLTDDPWGSDPSYYSTLRLGDASGDGRQDTLIARGPYGIRTWFYGRPVRRDGARTSRRGIPRLPGRSSPRICPPASCLLSRPSWQARM